MSRIRDYSTPPRAARELLVRLRTKTAGPGPPMVGEPTSISVDRYLDPAICEREKALLSSLPLVLTESGALREPGAFIAHEGTGTPILLVRDREGRARAYLNSCRHRGTRVCEGRGRTAAFACPYHGWVYGLDGGLTKVPHEEAFAPLDRAARSLVELACEERHGLIFVRRDGGPIDLSAWLGGLEDDLEWLGLDRHVAFRTARVERNANWKLLIEAFLEAYHIRRLHQGTLGPFFLDATADIEPVGQHVRAATARKEIVAEPPPEDVRLQATYSYLLFPNTVLIVHPGYMSRVSVHPIAPDRLAWEHTLLVPEDDLGEGAREHYDRSFVLIEETAFQKEDLLACERIQDGLRTGANETLLFGRLEHAISHFHGVLARALSGEIG